jgi:hypothetical protein
MEPKLVIHVRQTDKSNDGEAYTAHALQGGYTPMNTYALQIARLEQSTGVAIGSYSLISDDADVYASAGRKFNSYFKAGAAVTALLDTKAIAAVSGHKGGHESVQGAQSFHVNICKSARSVLVLLELRCTCAVAYDQASYHFDPSRVTNQVLSKSESMKTSFSVACMLQLCQAATLLG